MLSLILGLFLLWLFFKLGIGVIKIFAFLFVAIITAIFFTYLLLPLLALGLIGGLLWAVVR
ncbi:MULTISPECIES: hypothetical protein [Lactobacillus]|uniref:Uncharacterized protein n=1 Tax=Lactobacillus xujianguonis TaxID=2495899 RepID=A0A437SXA4_9LACO|nr:MULTISPECIES: hypothetical protein [Lactobacillus]RVU71532.1 hypothetical protein EJK17_02190 [Lactobacillus xujianguonis]RVU76719.1 hypothetical protein EJK20_04350 [Lactobacillus xujianguonis]